MIYFDNAATTRASQEVAEKMTEMLCHNFGNPASINKLGLQVEKEIRKATEILSRGIHCKPTEIFYTSGGTEGDNWAIFGTAEGYRGRHLITTKIEHPAVKKPMEALQQKGYDVTFLPVDKKERVWILEELKKETRTIIVYEAPHHLVRTLKELGEVLGEERNITICRELTKKYEEVYRTTFRLALERYEREEPKGEFVIVIAGKKIADMQKEQQISWEDLCIEEHM